MGCVNEDKEKKGDIMRTIVSLEAENIKRLKAVRIEPDGSVIVVGGKNAQGKSSVLDAIAMAVGGKKLCPEEPIRQGQKSARVAVDLGDLTVERKFTAKGSSLAVKSADGAKYPSPQAILDEMVQTLTFDPLEFCRSSPKEQATTLAQVAGVDLAGIAEERAALYDQRTDIGRERDQAKARLASLAFDHDAPPEEVSLADLLERLKCAREVNRKGAELADGIKAHEDTISTMRGTILALEGRVAQAKADLEAEEAKMETEEQALAADVAAHTAYEWADDGAIEEEVAGAEEVNAAVRSNRLYASTGVSVDVLTGKWEKFTANIDALDERKRELVANSNLPIAGLSFDEDGVFFEEVPLAQASQAEQLRISVAMGLAMNPELNIMLIRDGSLLDEDNLAMLAEMAKEAEAQLWIERVGDGPEVSVLIEDGEVKS